jgi:hypothetical protein
VVAFITNGSPDDSAPVAAAFRKGLNPRLPEPLTRRIERVCKQAAPAESVMRAHRFSTH